jgi:hypothetical protein
MPTVVWERAFLIFSRVVYLIYAYDGSEEEGYERQARTKGGVDWLTWLEHGNVYKALWLINTLEVFRLMAFSICKISLASTKCYPVISP